MFFRTRAVGAALLALILTGGATLPSAAAAGGPVQTIGAFYQTLLAVMKAAKQEGFNARYRELAPAVVRTFNLPLMTRIAVGPEWASLNRGQQQQLTAAFQRYTIATYASRFDGYSGERFEVARQTVANPNGIIVESRLIQSDGKPVALNYLMRRSATGVWKVIDIYLSGTISELATRRSEFVSVLHRQGADALVRLLERRAAALGTG